MFLCFIFIFSLCGFIRGSESYFIDTNRIRLLPTETEDQYTHESIIDNTLRRTNDYDDDNGSWKDESRGATQITRASSAPFKVHQSKQDPRLFYQSNSYLREVERKDLNRDVTYIYSGHEAMRSNGVKSPTLCIKCPHDMTLVAKSGSDRVFLQHPRLFTCSGRKAHRKTRFVQMYGPKFGTLIQEGSHLIIGRITYKGKSQHLCKMQVHVVTQGCVSPNYLISQCGHNRRCKFTCRNPKLELQEQNSLTCDSHMKWSGALPVCKARTWCDSPSPPENGHVACKSVSVNNTITRMAKGSRCHVKCVRGWHRSPRTFVVCRRGYWTHSLTCIKNRISSRICKLYICK